MSSNDSRNNNDDERPETVDKAAGKGKVNRIALMLAVVCWLLLVILANVPPTRLPSGHLYAIATVLALVAVGATFRLAYDFVVLSGRDTGAEAAPSPPDPQDLADAQQADTQEGLPAGTDAETLLAVEESLRRWAAHHQVALSDNAREQVAVVVAAQLAAHADAADVTRTLRQALDKAQIAPPSEAALARLVQRLAAPRPT